MLKSINKSIFAYFHDDTFNTTLPESKFSNVVRIIVFWILIPRTLIYQGYGARMIYLLFRLVGGVLSLAPF